MVRKGVERRKSINHSLLLQSQDHRCEVEHIAEGSSLLLKPRTLSQVTNKFCAHLDFEVRAASDVMCLQGEMSKFCLCVCVDIRYVCVRVRCDITYVFVRWNIDVLGIVFTPLKIFVVDTFSVGIYYSVLRITIVDFWASIQS